MLVTRVMSSWRRAASTTASSPATAPVCASAASLPGLAGTNLHRHDRLAGLVGPASRCAERGRVADLLQEHADDPGLLVGDQVVEHVSGSDHRLVAQARHRAHADCLSAREREKCAGQRAALQGDADRAGRQRQRHGERERRGLGGGVEEAERVRAEDDDAAPGGRGHQVVFEFAPGGASLPVAGGEDDHISYPGRSGVVDHAGDRFGGSQDEREVSGLGEVAQRAHGRAAEDPLVPRVHRQQRPLVADRTARRHDEARPAGRLGRTDHRDAARREELREPLRRDQRAGRSLTIPGTAAADRTAVRIRSAGRRRAAVRHRPADRYCALDVSSAISRARLGSEISATGHVSSFRHVSHARARGSFGRPSARSAMMLRWISFVPE